MCSQVGTSLSEAIGKILVHKVLPAFLCHLTKEVFQALSSSRCLRACSTYISGRVIFWVFSPEYFFARYSAVFPGTLITIHQIQ